jgi:hypothetical protein
MDKTYTLSQAEVAVFDREAYAIMLDITTLWEITKVRPLFLHLYAVHIIPSFLLLRV